MDFANLLRALQSEHSRVSRQCKDLQRENAELRACLMQQLDLEVTHSVVLDDAVLDGGPLNQTASGTCALAVSPHCQPHTSSDIEDEKQDDGNHTATSDPVLLQNVSAEKGLEARGLVSRQCKDLQRENAELRACLMQQLDLEVTHSVVLDDAVLDEGPLNQTASGTCALAVSPHCQPHTSSDIEDEKQDDGNHTVRSDPVLLQNVSAEKGLEARGLELRWDLDEGFEIRGMELPDITGNHGGTWARQPSKSSKATTDSQCDTEIMEEFGDLEDWQQQMVDLFKELDTSGSGSLSIQELRGHLTSLGVPLARTTRICKIVDKNNGEGDVCIDAWVRAIKRDREIAQMSSALLRRKSSEQFIEEKACASCQHIIIMPQSKLRVSFDLVMALACLYIGLALPFEVAWNDALSPQALAMFEDIDRCIQYWFFLDIFLNFFTAYHGREDELISDPLSIAKHYLRTWFALDVFSSFPFEYITQGGMKNMMAVKLLKISRLLRLMKLLKPRNFSLEDFSDVLDDFLHSKMGQFIKRKLPVLLQTVFVCHWLACGMKLVDEGYLSLYEGVGGRLWPEYLAAVYWAMTTLTTVGYGDIIPSSDRERAYTLCAMVVGGGFYGYVIGAISSTISNCDLNQSAYYDRMDLVHAWLSHHNLPVSLKRTLRRFFQGYLHEKSAINEADVWRDLSPALQRAVGQYIIHEHVRYNPLFDGISMGALVRLQAVLRKLIVPPRSTLTHKGEVGTAMYIIVSGLMQIDEQELQRRGGNTLGPGQSFGEEVILGFMQEYEYTVTVLEEAKVEMILDCEFLSAFENLPNELQRMRQNALSLHPEFASANPLLPSSTSPVRGNKVESPGFSLEIR